MKNFKKSGIPLAIGALGSVLLLAGGVVAFGDTNENTTGSAPTTSNKTSFIPGIERQVYIARLLPMNNKVGGSVNATTGTARIVVDGDHLGITLDATGLEPGSMHSAQIRKGARCAGLSEDKNGDGFIDATEDASTAGEVLLNLDGNINSFSEGSDFRLTPDEFGNLSYIASGSVNQIMKDLQNPSMNVGSHANLLKQNDKVDINQAVIEIQGVDPSTHLPSSVETIAGSTASESLPISCGKLIQVSGPTATLPITEPSPTGSSSPSVVPSTGPSAMPSMKPVASPAPSMNPTTTPSSAPHVVTPAPTPSEGPSASPSSVPPKRHADRS